MNKTFFVNYFFFFANIRIKIQNFDYLILLDLLYLPTLKGTIKSDKLSTSVQTTIFLVSISINIFSFSVLLSTLKMKQKEY